MTDVIQAEVSLGGWKKLQGIPNALAVISDFIAVSAALIEVVNYST